MIKKILSFILLGIGLLLLVILTSNIVINASTNDQTFSDVNTIANNKVGLVLGTSKKLSSGAPNLFYAYRIKAAVTLFKAKKVDFILVSGDNGTKYYNEPSVFKKDLMEAGIPEDKIFLDYAGFRTLDSMVRAKEVFGLTNVTVISQKFHNQRAIYLAHKKGLNAIGFNAQDVTGKNGLKVHAREYLARVKVFIDLLTNAQPKFFGEKVEIK